MALIFVLLPEAERTEHRRHHYHHIECDVDGCEGASPTSRELAERKTSLMEMGWFIDGGQHRCPTHFHDEVPARGPQYRDE